MRFLRLCWRATLKHVLMLSPNSLEIDLGGSKTTWKKLSLSLIAFQSAPFAGLIELTNQAAHVSAVFPYISPM